MLLPCFYRLEVSVRSDPFIQPAPSFPSFGTRSQSRVVMKDYISVPDMSLLDQSVMFATYVWQQRAIQSMDSP